MDTEKTLKQPMSPKQQPHSLPGGLNALPWRSGGNGVVLLAGIGSYRGSPPGL